MTSWISWDTETSLIRQGIRAPALTCVSVCSEAGPGHPSTYPATLLDRKDGLAWFWDAIKDPNVGLIGLNVAFDVCVMMQEDPKLIPWVFKAYDEDRIVDVKVRQQLLDIAAGGFWGLSPKGRFVKYTYDLDTLSRRLLGWQLDKDTYRLKYGELRDVPLDQWEPGAQEYPKNDARATLALFLAQEQQNEGGAYLKDQFRQARRFLSLFLCEAWGLRTRPEGVEAFAKEVDAKVAEIQGELITLGLARKDGSRDTKAASRLMVQICTEAGIGIVPTKGGEKILSMGGELKDKGVALDADTCERCEDPRMIRYAEFGTSRAVQSKDLKMLRSGVRWPIHSRFSMAETGRSTSSKPNIQNLRVYPGIRECFVPRAGYVFAQGDYPSLELHTLAQTCIDLFGHSRLAEVLNAGGDPHTELACRMLDISYEEGIQRKDSKEPIFYNTRQAAKVANFGFPGGMGAASFVSFARSSYGVVITEAEAKVLKRQWLEMWPEMKDFFRYVGGLCENEDGGVVVLARPERIRGGLRYTAACNTFFQGLGADAAGAAGWDIAKACYVDATSPLYGSRMVAFVHDEFILETLDGPGASAAAWELCRIMRDSANRWLPDVPFADVEPCLMGWWSKQAKTIIEDGQVKVWRG